MAITRTFNGATLLKPGAYSKIIVENLGGFPLQASGTVGIIGEAAGGQPGVLDILSSAQVQSAKARYKSGPIADALGLVSAPSNDPRVPNGASTIMVWKTNPSTQSAASLSNNSALAKLALVSKNYGSDENVDSVSVAMGSVADSNATILGSIPGPFATPANGSLVLKINGVTYTYITTLAAGSHTTAALVADMQTSANWSPSKPVIASAVGQLVQIALDTTAVAQSAHDYGYIIVDPSSTLETVIGIVGSVRGAKGSRILTFKKGLVTEQMMDAGGIDQLSVQYIGSGTDANLTIAPVLGALTLTSVVAGAAGDDLNIALSTTNGKPLITLGQLVDLLNSGGKYAAVLKAPSAAINASLLDHYAGIECKGMPAVLRADDNALMSIINLTSNIAVASLPGANGELAVTAAPVFFTGGSDGASSNSDYAAGFEAMQEERVNVVVPLISADTGAVTIDSVNALASQHATWGWSTTGKSERSVFASKKASKAEFKKAAQTLNNGFLSLVGQSVTVLNSQNALVDLDPWAYACICAGMRAGAEVGEPLTFKTFNVNNLFVADGSWNPKTDFNEMIAAGCWIGEGVDGGGFRHVVGNTTYNIDPSFVYNRESVVQAAGYVAYDLRFNLELTFTGTKAKTGTATAIANFIKARMTAYLGADIIVGDDLNGGLGYYSKTLRVNVSGDTAEINVAITPVQGIDFILPTIYLADIQQSA
jgi:hypothetical protein